MHVNITLECAQIFSDLYLILVTLLTIIAIEKIYRGKFDERDVAVKRILPECFSFADREVF